jgi:hypothetical protein
MELDNHRERPANRRFFAGLSRQRSLAYLTTDGEGEKENRRSEAIA